MYIAVLDEVPDHMVPVLVAHATLGAHLEFCYDGNMLYFEWLESSFRKVVLRVNRKEFEKISQLDYVYLAHENSTLNGEKSCAVVCPREDNPRVLAFAKMWSPLANEALRQVQKRLPAAEKQLSDYSWQQGQNSPYRIGL